MTNKVAALAQAIGLSYEEFLSDCLHVILIEGGLKLAELPPTAERCLTVCRGGDQSGRKYEIIVREVQ